MDELSVVAPQHARELLRTLEAAQLLRVQTTAGGAGAGSPRSVLAACFWPGGSTQAEAGAAAGRGDDRGGGSDGSSGEEEEAQAGRRRFYFAPPAACFGASRVLPPQALLPLAPAPGRG